MNFLWGGGGGRSKDDKQQQPPPRKEAGGNLRGHSSSDVRQDDGDDNDTKDILQNVPQHHRRQQQEEEAATTGPTSSTGSDHHHQQQEQGEEFASKTGVTSQTPQQLQQQHQPEPASAVTPTIEDDDDGAIVAAAEAAALAAMAAASSGKLPISSHQRQFLNPRSKSSSSNASSSASAAAQAPPPPEPTATKRISNSFLGVGGGGSSWFKSTLFGGGGTAERDDDDDDDKKGKDTSGASKQTASPQEEEAVEEAVEVVVEHQESGDIDISSAAVVSTDDGNGKEGEEGELGEEVMLSSTPSTTTREVEQDNDDDNLVPSNVVVDEDDEVDNDDDDGDDGEEKGEIEATISSSSNLDVSVRSLLVGNINDIDVNVEPESSQVAASTEPEDSSDDDGEEGEAAAPQDSDDGFKIVEHEQEDEAPAAASIEAERPRGHPSDDDDDDDEAEDEAPAAAEDGRPQDHESGDDEGSKVDQVSQEQQQNQDQHQGQQRVVELEQLVNSISDEKNHLEEVINDLSNTLAKVTEELRVSKHKEQIWKDQYEISTKSLHDSKSRLDTFEKDIESKNAEFQRLLLDQSTSSHHYGLNIDGDDDDNNNNGDSFRSDSSGESKDDDDDVEGAATDGSGPPSDTFQSQIQELQNELQLSKTQVVELQATLQETKDQVTTLANERDAMNSSLVRTRWKMANTLVLLNEKNAALEERVQSLLNEKKYIDDKSMDGDSDDTPPNANRGFDTMARSARSTSSTSTGSSRRDQQHDFRTSMVTEISIPPEIDNFNESFLNFNESIASLIPPTIEEFDEEEWVAAEDDADDDDIGSPKERQNDTVLLAYRDDYDEGAKEEAEEAEDDSPSDKWKHRFEQLKQHVQELEESNRTSERLLEESEYRLMRVSVHMKHQELYVERLIKQRQDEHKQGLQSEGHQDVIFALRAENSRLKSQLQEFQQELLLTKDTVGSHAREVTEDMGQLLHDKNDMIKSLSLQLQEQQEQSETRLQELEREHSKQIQLLEDEYKTQKQNERERANNAILQSEQQRNETSRITSDFESQRILFKNRVGTLQLELDSNRHQVEELKRLLEESDERTMRVSRHLVSRDEAYQRLNDTKTSVEVHMRDLMAELEEQRLRARALQDDANFALDKEREISQQRHDELNRVLMESKERAELVSADFTHQQEELDRLKEEMKESESKWEITYNELEEQRRVAEKLMEDWNKERSVSQSLSGVLQSEREQSTQRIEELETAVKESTDENHQVVKQLQERESECSQLRSEKETLESEITTISTRLEEQQRMAIDQLAEMEQDLVNAEGQIDMLQSDNDKLKSELKTATSSLHEIRRSSPEALEKDSDITQLESKLSVLSFSLQESKQEVDSANEEKAALEERVTQLQAFIDEATGQMTDMEKQLITANDEISELQMERIHLTAQLQQTKKTMEKLSADQSVKKKSKARSLDLEGSNMSSSDLSAVRTRKRELELVNAHSRLQEADRTKASLRAEISSLSSRANELDSQLKKTTQDLVTAQQEVERWKTKQMEAKSGSAVSLDAAESLQESVASVSNQPQVQQRQLSGPEMSGLQEDTIQESSQLDVFTAGEASDAEQQNSYALRLQESERLCRESEERAARVSAHLVDRESECERLRLQLLQAESRLNSMKVEHREVVSGMDEMEEQLQASKAEIKKLASENDKLETRIRENQILLSKIEVERNDSTMKITELRRRLSESEVLGNAIRSENQEYKRQKNEYKRLLDESEERTMRVSAHFVKQGAAHERLVKQSEALEVRMTNLLADLEASESTKTALEHKATAFEANLASLQKDRDSLFSQLQEEQTLVKKMKNRKNDAELHSEVLQGRLHAAEMNIQDLYKRLEASDVEIADLESQRDALLSKLEGFDIARSVEREEKSSLEAKVEDLQTHLGDSAEQIITLERQVADSDVQIKSLQTENSDLSKRLQELASLVEKADDEMSSSRKRIDTLESDLSQTKASLQALEEQKSAAIEQSSSLENRVAALDAAVEEASRELNDARDDADSWKDKHDCLLSELSVLRSSKTSVERLLEESEERTTRVSVRLVRCEAELESLLRVKEAAEAKVSTLSENLEEQRLRTEKISTDFEKQLNATKRQINALQVENDSLSSRLEESNEKLSAAEDNVGTAEAQNIALQGRLSSAQEANEILQRRVEAMEAEQSPDTQLRSLDSGNLVGDLEAQLKASNDQVMELEEEKNALQTQILDIQRETHDFEGQLEIVKQKENHLVSELSDASTRIKELEASVANGEHRSQQLEQELSEACELKVSLDRQVKDLEENLSIIRSELEQSIAFGQRMKGEKEVAEAELNKQAESFDKLNQRLREAESLLSAAKAEQKELLPPEPVVQIQSPDAAPVDDAELEKSESSIPSAVARWLATQDTTSSQTSLQDSSSIQSPVRVPNIWTPPAVIEGFGQTEFSESSSAADGASSVKELPGMPEATIAQTSQRSVEPLEQVQGHADLDASESSIPSAVARGFETQSSASASQASLHDSSTVSQSPALAYKIWGPPTLGSESMGRASDNQSTSSDSWGPSKLSGTTSHSDATKERWELPNVPIATNTIRAASAKRAEPSSPVSSKYEVESATSEHVGDSADLHGSKNSLPSAVARFLENQSVASSASSLKSPVAPHKIWTPPALAFGDNSSPSVVASINSSEQQPLGDQAGKSDSSITSAVARWLADQSPASTSQKGHDSSSTLQSPVATYKVWTPPALPFESLNADGNEESNSESDSSNTWDPPAIAIDQISPSTVLTSDNLATSRSIQNISTGAALTWDTPNIPIASTTAFTSQAATKPSPSSVSSASSSFEKASDEGSMDKGMAVVSTQATDKLLSDVVVCGLENQSLASSLSTFQDSTNYMLQSPGTSRSPFVIQNRAAIVPADILKAETKDAEASPNSMPSAVARWLETQGNESPSTRTSLPPSSPIQTYNIWTPPSLPLTSDADQYSEATGSKDGSSNPLEATKDMDQSQSSVPSAVARWLETQETTSASSRQASIEESSPVRTYKIWTPPTPNIESNDATSDESGSDSDDDSWAPPKQSAEVDRNLGQVADHVSSTRKSEGNTYGHGNWDLPDVQLATSTIFTSAQALERSHSSSSAAYEEESLNSDTPGKGNEAVDGSDDGSVSERSLTEELSKLLEEDSISSSSEQGGDGESPDHGTSDEVDDLSDGEAEVSKNVQLRTVTGVDEGYGAPQASSHERRELEILLAQALSKSSVLERKLKASMKEIAFLYSSLREERARQSAAKLARAATTSVGLQCELLRVQENEEPESSFEDAQGAWNTQRELEEVAEPPAARSLVQSEDSLRQKADEASEPSFENAEIIRSVQQGFEAVAEPPAAQSMFQHQMPLWQTMSQTTESTFDNAERTVSFQHELDPVPESPTLQPFIPPDGVGDYGGIQLRSHDTRKVEEETEGFGIQSVDDSTQQHSRDVPADHEVTVAATLANVTRRSSTAEGEPRTLMQDKSESKLSDEDSGGDFGGRMEVAGDDNVTTNGLLPSAVLVSLGGDLLEAEIEIPADARDYVNLLREASAGLPEEFVSALVAETHSFDQESAEEEPEDPDDEDSSDDENMSASSPPYAFNVQPLWVSDARDLTDIQSPRLVGEDDDGEFDQVRKVKELPIELELHHHRRMFVRKARYTGPIVNGLPQGQGILRFEDGGGSYLGEFQDGEMHGVGLFSKQGSGQEHRGDVWFGGFIQNEFAGPLRRVSVRHAAAHRIRQIAHHGGGVFSQGDDDDSNSTSST